MTTPSAVSTVKTQKTLPLLSPLGPASQSRRGRKPTPTTRFESQLTATAIEAVAELACGEQGQVAVHDTDRGCSPRAVERTCLGGSSPTRTNGTGPSPSAKLTTKAMMPADARVKWSVLMAQPRTAVEADIEAREKSRRVRRPRRCGGVTRCQVTSDLERGEIAHIDQEDGWEGHDEVDCAASGPASQHGAANGTGRGAAHRE